MRNILFAILLYPIFVSAQNDTIIPARVLGDTARIRIHISSLKNWIGLSNVSNITPANYPISTATQTAINLKLNISDTNSMLSPYPRTAAMNTLLAGKQNTITVLPFANGGISGSAATSATTGTISVSMTTSIITCTPTGAMTLNATGGVAGQIITFSFTTSGTTSFTITFGTNFRKTAVLATGTTSARFFTVTFRCLSDNGIWTEISRTAAQT